MPTTTLVGSPFQQYRASISLSSIFTGSGIRLRERQSFLAFLRTRSRGSRSVHNGFSRVIFQCTMVPLSKSFCTLAVVWLLRQLISPDRECRIKLRDVRKLHFYTLQRILLENCALPFLITQ